MTAYNTLESAAIKITQSGPFGKYLGSIGFHFTDSGKSFMQLVRIYDDILGKLD